MAVSNADNKSAVKPPKPVSDTADSIRLQATLKQQQNRIRELEQALQTATDERSRALEEAQALTHLGSWQWDIANNHISWSDELYRIYGLKPQEREVSFDEFMGMVHDADRERVGSIIGTSFKTGKPFSFQHRIVTAGGTTRWLYGLGKVLKDKEGQPLRMIGTSQDITARVAANNALQRSDERFRAITTATHDLVYDLDLHSDTIWFNETLQNVYGYNASSHDRPITWWLARIHPDDRATVKEQVEHLRRSTEQTWEVAYRFRKADDSYTLVRNRAFVTHNGNKPERIIGSCLDITEAKRLDRAKDEFISLVSHQLRTPLTVIQLYGNMLRGGLAEPLKPDQQEYVDKMTNASVRLIKLVGDILNISRLELNRIRIDSQPTDVNQLIQVHIDELCAAAKAKRTSVMFTPENLKPIRLDGTIFGEIIHNLISNAVRYVRPEDGEIAISFTKEDDGYLLIVKDNGIGIPKAAQSHIFERFYRATNATRVDGEGTGLGLYLVKMFAETTGGQAWFNSVEGKGTTFFVSLPLSGMKSRIVKS